MKFRKMMSARRKMISRKLTDKYVADVDKMLAHKEAELMQV
jgi:ribosome recycling factor